MSRPRVCVVCGACACEVIEAAAQRSPRAQVGTNDMLMRGGTANRGACCFMGSCEARSAAGRREALFSLICAPRHTPAQPVYCRRQRHVAA